MKIHLTTYILLVLTLLGEKKSFKEFDKKDKYVANASKSTFNQDNTLYPLLNWNIDPFDTKDCVFHIFSKEKNLNYFESKATRIAQNKSEIPLTTLAEVSKGDTTLTSESYLNKFIGIAFVKYYKSGILSSYGFQFGEKEKIGKWKYFSTYGNLDSIVDLANRRSMNFCKFFEIAHAFGMVGENSKISERKRFFEIADSLGLKNCNSSKVFSKPNWRDLEFYPVHQEEEKGRFTCKISYSLWHSNEWTIEKQFNIEGKSLCFCLSVFPETNEVCLYEAFNVK